MSGAASPPIVVIGAGPCAAVAARELVEAGLPVLMLDAGPGVPRGITVRLAGRTVVRAVQPGFRSLNRQRSATDQRTEWTSSLSLGGLTNYWTGAAPRFHPEDFVEGGQIGEAYDWPIRYRDLLEYYDRCEDDLHLTVGPGFSTVPAGRGAHRYSPPADWAAVAAAARRAGHEIGPIPIARGNPWMVALRAREFTSYHSVIRRYERAAEFRLVSDARVLRLHPRDDGGADVVYRGIAGGVTTVPARAVVVAAGALDTTEILLRSRSADFPDGLGNGTGVLGRYLHDHPKEWWNATVSRPLTALHHPLYVPRLPYGTEPLLASSLTIGLGRGRDRLPTLWSGKVPRVGVQVFGTVVPADRLAVTLVDDHDPDAHESQLVLDLTFDETTAQLMDAARDRFAALMAAAGIDVELGPRHDLAPAASNHLAGTARMHADPRYGVVDGWNRVHGAPQVLAVDASCFTTGPEKNPTLTAMAIAARAAARLAAETR